MKIAYTGAHCVGKTSLAEKLHSLLTEFIFIPEPYVELEEQGHSFSGTPNLEDLCVQLEYALERIDIDEPDVIFDRCPLDLLVYIHVMGGPEVSRKFYLKVREAMDEIDLLIFVPVESPDPIECPESEFPKLRKQVNELLTEWITDFDLDTVTVKGTLEQRERQVLETINSLY